MPTKDNCECGCYDINKPFWRQKKFYAMLLAVSIPVANQLIGWELEFGVVWTMVAPVLAYIGVQGYVDARH